MPHARLILVVGPGPLDGTCILHGCPELGIGKVQICKTIVVFIPGNDRVFGISDLQVHLRLTISLGPGLASFLARQCRIYVIDAGIYVIDAGMNLPAQLR